MRLTIAIPNRIQLDEPVTKVAAEGMHGAFTLLPRHLDYVVILEPGILTYTDEEDNEHYVAVDGGVLTKAGPEVRVSTPAAVPGDQLEDLKRTVDETFRRLDETEQLTRVAQARIETRVLHEMFEFEEPR
ncbi:MAG TPA: F0F1 ATP synthase subunit epsilon [Acidimicrobiia bacterium]|nr:F0F1 ATP synthase subunit epsilon [Acidimicrobiia bacterium]